MTWGSVATEGVTDATIARDQKTTQERTDKRGMWEAEGRAALGYQQDRDGIWQQRHVEQTMGYPAALVNAARTACTAEAVARAAVQRTEQQIQPRIAKIAELDEAAARSEWAKSLAEPVDTCRTAVAAAKRACSSLGEAVESIKELRTIINAGPVELQAIDHRAAAARRAVEDRVESARQALMRWGVQ